MVKYYNQLENIMTNTPITSVTSASYTALLTDYIIDVSFAGAVTITLPAPSTTGLTTNVGKIWIIKDVSGNAVTNNITLLPASGTIDGQVSLKIVGNFGYYAVTTNGTNYFTIAANSAASTTPTINIQKFTASGTYTPSVNLGYAVVECLGGGGGSGGTANIPSTANAVAVAGGGAGSYSRSVLMPVTIGASQTVTIGAAGTAGSPGPGGNGGTTSFGALVTAPGGNATGSPTASALGSSQGGNGGALGTGQFTTTGQAGGTAFWQVISAGTSYLAIGGMGGTSHYGGAGQPAAITVANTINSSSGSNGFGNGGSGPAATGNSGGSSSGTPGTAGVCIVTEYIFTPVASQIGSAVIWTSVAGTSQQMAQQTGYFTTSGSATTLTLPTTAQVGSMMAVLGTGAGLWTIAQNAGQSIEYGTQISTVGTGGSLKSSNVGDEVWLLCTTANTTWFVTDSNGNIAVT